MNQPAVSPPPSAPAAAPPLLFVLLDAAHRLDARVEADLARIGLSPGKAQVLEALAGSSRPMPLSEIALCNRGVRSNITQLVDRLEADGLVRRVNDPGDRRVRRATLTPDGRSSHRAALRIRAQQDREFVVALGPDDERALAGGLGRRMKAALFLRT